MPSPRLPSAQSFELHQGVAVVCDLLAGCPMGADLGGKVRKGGDGRAVDAADPGMVGDVLTARSVLDRDIDAIVNFVMEDRDLSTMEYDKLIKYLLGVRSKTLNKEYGGDVPANLLAMPIGPESEKVHSCLIASESGSRYGSGKKQNANFETMLNSGGILMNFN